MKVLICPLDWGLGHATRCIPLIRALLANHHHVLIGATGGGLQLLRKEFPDLDAFDFPGYRVRYSRSPALFLPIMLSQMAFLIAGLFRERSRLRRILREKSPDLVISDGRYGVFTRSVPSIFITHQVFIRVPGRFPGIALAEKLVLALNLRLLRKFSQVWVPDFAGPKNLSGDLSHQPCDLTNLVFINPLSRFGAGEIPAKPAAAIPEVEILAMVSGPEPQRGIFEAALSKELEGMPGTRVLVRGLPGSSSAGMLTEAVFRPGTLNLFDHLPGDILAVLLSRAKLVVARAGYTTVMEMAGLGVKAAILVPTPGQSEQEYLAFHLRESGTAMCMDQENLNLSEAMRQIHGYSGFAAWSKERSDRQEDALVGATLFDFLRSHPLFQPSGIPSIGSPVSSAKVGKTG